MVGRIALVRCDPQVRESRYAVTHSLVIDPVVDVLAGRILIKAVAFLDFAFKLFALAGNLIEIVIRKIAPLLLDLALQLLPVSLNAIPIHSNSFP
jgi:hypothetical protein